MADEKPIIWVKSSYDDLKGLPKTPRREIGFALSDVQAGEYPDNSKPLTGKDLKGVYEIRTHDEGNTFRAVYVVNLGKHLYVLHVFQKKSKKGIATPKKELDLIRSRLKRAQEIAKELEHGT